MMNPLLTKSHPAHVAVKKFYLGKKFNDDWKNNNYFNYEINEKKKARLKDKLADNFLLKRSSDLIVIIVSISSISLLLSRKKITEN